jgi:hypothetical protein
VNDLHNFEREVPKFEILLLELLPSAQRAAASKMATMQHNTICVRELIKTEFFLWGYVKEAVYVRHLPTTLVDTKKHITTPVNSVA